MAFDPLSFLRGRSSSGSAPLSGTRQERMQRLQIGLFGLGSMVLLVGLANIILASAQQNRAVVPEEAVVTPTQDVPPPPPRDPLADAGVAPDLVEPETPATGTPLPTPPEGGNAALPPQN